MFKLVDFYSTISMKFKVEFQTLIRVYLIQSDVKQDFFAGANQNVENKEKKKPFQVAKPEVVEALRKLLSNKRGGWNNKRGRNKYQGQCAKSSIIVSQYPILLGTMGHSLHSTSDGKDYLVWWCC